MKPAPFTYHTPSSVEECVQLLADHSFDSVVLSGGQSLIPLMRFRLAQPEHVISIRNVFGSSPGIRRTDNSTIISAGVTYSEIECHADIVEALPQLIRTIELVAYPGIRNRGTLIGNLCQADPASELPALALLFDAKFKCVSVAGERIVDAADFFLGPYTTARQDDELVVEVEFPDRPEGERFSINEVTRLRGGFPMAGVALSFLSEQDGSCRNAAIACFGVNYKQTRLPQAEAALNNLGVTPEGVAEAAKAIDGDISPHTDPYASETYRRKALKALFIRSIEEASN